MRIPAQAAAFAAPLIPVFLGVALMPAGCATGSLARNVAAVHSDTTPYDNFGKKLEMESGQTFLGFMRSEVKPALDSFSDAIAAEEKAKPKQYSKWQADLIDQGNGVAIRIDSKNYFFNVGYGTGENKDDIKSGRSYGVGPTGRESDPSDAFYLKELESYLKGESSHIGTFYKAIMLALTGCDASGWSDLSTEGQMVATDFMAIYTAESDRHLMVKLSPTAHPWEIDLGATTLVSTFDVATGKIEQAKGSGFELVDGGIDQWWAKGQQGSGIGETRRARKDLTAKIGAYEKKNHPELISAIESVIGKSKGSDVIQGVFEYLNSPSGPDKLGSKADTLTNAVVKYVEQVQDDSSDITSSM